MSKRIEGNILEVFRMSDNVRNKLFKKIAETDNTGIFTKNTSDKKILAVPNTNKTCFIVFDFCKCVVKLSDIKEGVAAIYNKDCGLHLFRIDSNDIDYSYVCGAWDSEVLRITEDVLEQATEFSEWLQSTKKWADMFK